jgi:lipoate synthase
MEQEEQRIPKPKWLKVKLPTGEKYRKVRSLVDEHKLHTICESGNCPNMGECWGEGTATFMILGNICTRSCGFCAVATGKPFEIAPYFMADMSVSVPLLKEHIVIQTGCKNIFGVTQVLSSASTGSIHSNNTGNLNIANGRNLLLSIKINL